MFARNVGSIDGTIRILLGVGVVPLFFVYPEHQWRYATLLGLVPLLTGLSGTCPLYSLFGFSTCPAGRG